MQRIGYVIGWLLMLRGVLLTFNPQLWRSVTEHYFLPRVPKPMSQMVTEYTRLSDQSLSVLGIWAALTGLVLVVLSSQMREY